MAQHIPENILEEIQMRNDIVEVIGGYIPLRRAGANFKAPCPFHNERTPSFMVSPTKQIFHCFGCGAGGNVFGFLMKHEHLDFIDAVKLLAERTGVKIPEKISYPGQESARGLWEVNKFAANLFHKYLKGSRAYQYLKGRGFNDDLIAKFQLGYAPGGDCLLREARQAGFSAELLIKAGLVVSRAGRQQDMFHERLLVPICNIVGKVAGFSGRVLDDSLPKYVNTPESPVFHKGKMLYGLSAAKGEIVKQGFTVIVEGYFDALRAFQEGMRGIVASMGTAFTRDHVQMLRRYSKEIVVAFDSDTAGNKAALGGLEIFIQEGVRVRIVDLPAGADPDSFIRARGIAAFHKLVSDARDILEVKLDRLAQEYSIKTTKGKLQIADQLLPDIAKINNDIWKRQFVKYLGTKLVVPEESIWLELQKHKKKGGAGFRPSQTTEKIVAGTNRFPGEKQLICLLLDDEPLPDWLLRQFDPADMQDQLCRRILDLTVTMKRSGQWKGVQSLMYQVKDEKVLQLLSQLAAQDSSFIDRERVMRDCLYDIKRRSREAKIGQLIGSVAEAEKNQEDIIGTMTEIKKLKLELLELQKCHCKC